MKHWIRDAIDAAKVIRRARKAGYTGMLTILSEKDLQLWGDEMRRHMDAYKLAYACIETMVAGKSACRYCMFREGCTNKKRGNLRGCEDWCLKFPEEKNEQTAAEENGKAEQENQAAGVQGNDA